MALTPIKESINPGGDIMKIAKENIEVKMEIPGAILRQRTDFGDASGLGKISGGISAFRRVWILPAFYRA